VYLLGAEVRDELDAAASQAQYAGILIGLDGDLTR
jgi:hypothetical protein